MKLTEMKKKILKLIEEYDKSNNTDYTNDPDIATKINEPQTKMFTVKSLPLLWVVQKFAISLQVIQRKRLVYPIHSGIPRNCSGEPLSYKIESGG